MKENVINTINWDNWDIVISTPQSLLNAINKQKDLLNPKTVVIDEADMLVTLDENVAAATKEVIKKYLPKGSRTEFMLAASSFPLKIKGV